MHDTDATTITSRRVNRFDVARVAQPVDVVVPRGVLLDVEVGLRDVRLGLVVVVVRDEVLDRVVREELAELVAELRRERLVVGDDQRRPADLLDRPRHRRRLAGAGRADQRLVALACLEPLGEHRRSPSAGRPSAGTSADVFSVGHGRHRVPGMATRNQSSAQARTRRSWGRSSPASPAPACSRARSGATPRGARAARPRRSLGARDVQGGADDLRATRSTSFIREPFVEGDAHEGGEEPVADRRPPPGDRRARHLQPLRRHVGRRRADDDAGRRAALRPAADLVARRRRRERLPPGRRSRRSRTRATSSSDALATNRGRPVPASNIRGPDAAASWTRTRRDRAGARLARARRRHTWPFKPFDKQHPIRGFFGDPRTVYENGILAGGFDGPGFFSFHQGVDISAPERNADLSGRRAGPRTISAPRR